ncbi:iron-containing alcohol dehydrogenase [Candidatus Enterococcus ferrettii]|uniref:1,3-propanediol dehydrogenase n=1 Tax=Candidatus Enterococcus ferrettii TaxID=2815324 RepID=A0ABV0EPF1_9ENTE|nr:iron-containing alcohol dehydrogenase [Enterococcus sp. 665A]MBO1340711.1 iron-containing alcohol dehydrogenase [Enterococcus sp. 665A]
MTVKDFLMPSLNYFGEGSVDVLGDKVEMFNAEKSLIVTDAFLRTLKDGPVAQVVKALEDKGIEYAIFDQVEPNPKIANCIAGLDLYNKENCDSVITVGGGSSHDCGKGIAIAVTHGKDLKKYAGIELLTEKLPPIFAVNTTAGTASEITKHCVLTDEETHLKFVIVSWRNVPLVSINDPYLMLSVPKGLTAATGMDALTHAVECYVSANATPLTDGCAIQAMKLIAQNLRQAVANGQDIAAREKMAYASVLAGMAFNNGDLGYVHAMAHQLGGQYDMAHGVANSILLPIVERYNLISNPEKFAKIAIYLGENTTGLSTLEAADKAIEAIERLSADVGIPKNLKVMGVKREDFELMAENALKDGNAFSNPRKGNKEEIIDLFEQAFE